MTDNELYKAILRLKANQKPLEPEDVPKPLLTIEKPPEEPRVEKTEQIVRQEEKPAEMTGINVRMALAAIPMVVGAFITSFFSKMKLGSVDRAEQVFKENPTSPPETRPPKQAASGKRTISGIFNEIGIRWKSAMDFLKKRLSFTYPKSGDTRDYSRTVPKNAAYSDGLCLNSVRETLNQAGIKLTPAARASDKVEGRGCKSMKEDGWVELNVADPDAYKNKMPGDVVVEEGTRAKPDGHIQLWTGGAWVSDFVQKSTHVHSLIEGKKHYYRYGPILASVGEVSNVENSDVFFVKRSDVGNKREVTYNDQFHDAYPELGASDESTNTWIREGNINQTEYNEMEIVDVPSRVTSL